MVTLWFKQLYVEPILSGEKTDTIRKSPLRSPLHVGEAVKFSVGPRPPFAVVEITYVEPIDLDAVSQSEPDRAAFLRAEYGSTPLVRIAFRLREILPPGRDLQRAAQRTRT